MHRSNISPHQSLIITNSPAATTRSGLAQPGGITANRGNESAMRGNHFADQLNDINFNITRSYGVAVSPSEDTNRMRFTGGLSTKSSGLNPLPHFVEPLDDYSKINLTTIQEYKEKFAVRPLLNASVLGRTNNLKDDLEFVAQAGSHITAEAQAVSRGIKDLRILLLERSAEKAMLENINSTWKRMRAEIESYKKEQVAVEQTVQEYSDRFSKISVKLEELTDRTAEMERSVGVEPPKKLNNMKSTSTLATQGINVAPREPKKPSKASTYALNFMPKYLLKK
jgi:hypothetical protein